MSAYFATLAAQAGAPVRVAASPAAAMAPSVSMAPAVTPLEQYADSEPAPALPSTLPINAGLALPIAPSAPETRAAAPAAMMAPALQTNPSLRPQHPTYAGQSAIATLNIGGATPDTRTTRDDAIAEPVSRQEDWLNSLVARAPQRLPAATAPVPAAQASQRQPMPTTAVPAGEHSALSPHGAAPIGASAQLAPLAKPAQASVPGAARPTIVNNQNAPHPAPDPSGTIASAHPIAALAPAPGMASAALAPGEPARAPLRANAAAPAGGSALRMLRIGSIALEVRSAAPVALPAPAPLPASFSARRHYLRWN